MPTYKYRREDGTTFTIRQKITADALQTCPDTGQPVERVITGGTGFHLKGGGWYADGYASADASDESEGNSSPQQNGSSDTGASDGADKNGTASAEKNGQSGDNAATNTESSATPANDAP